jgi:hypothetical protein
VSFGFGRGINVRIVVHTMYDARSLHSGDFAGDGLVNSQPKYC